MRPWSSPSPRSARATCRSMSRACRSSRRRITRTRAFDEIDARYAAGLRPVQGRQVRGQSLHRVRARQGLVGRRPAGLPRQLQFRRDPLRILPRSRRRLRRLHRQELSVSRGVHLAHLGDALRLPGHQGRPRQARGGAGRDARRAAQGWFINTRRDKFKDPRVREALIYAFDFEWTNKTIMYGAYARTHSPFQNSDHDGEGPPSPEELKLLEPFRGQVPDEVFGEPFVPPVSDGSGQDRALLRKAQQSAQRGRLRRQGRQAGAAQWRGLHDRVPERRGVVPAASRPRTSRISNTLGIEATFAPGRCRAVPRAGRGSSIST